MTATQRRTSATRAAALMEALTYSRAGTILTPSVANALYRQLGERGPLTECITRIHTVGGAVVTFTEVFGEYAVSVNASEI